MRIKLCVSQLRQSLKILTNVSFEVYFLFFGFNMPKWCYQFYYHFSSLFHYSTFHFNTTFTLFVLKKEITCIFINFMIWIFFFFFVFLQQFLYWNIKNESKSLILCAVDCCVFYCCYSCCHQHHNFALLLLACVLTAIKLSFLQFQWRAMA